MKQKLILFLVVFQLLPGGMLWGKSELPRVLLVGDSIRLSYQRVVRAELKGKAMVSGVKDNCESSEKVLKNIGSWVKGVSPKIIHFNAGLHDLQKSRSSKKHRVSKKRYQENLGAIVAFLRKSTDAIVLFSTSTPLIDERIKPTRSRKATMLFAKDVGDFNSLAIQRMSEYKVPVNDLYGHLLKRPDFQSLFAADGIHLSPIGSKVAGESVAKFIEAFL